MVPGERRSTSVIQRHVWIPRDPKRVAFHARFCLKSKCLQVFNHVRPGLHYMLRMYRPDEHEVAWQVGGIRTYWKEVRMKSVDIAAEMGAAPCTAAPCTVAPDPSPL